ncbi:MAG: molybdenum cofactor guanylyltransferase [Planctomycetes bacterium]|nr:molybdenum cofactor guanylyltransferase [Planctomycetota bacterium]
MGHPKAWLPFGPELMLPRIVRILSEVAGPVVVVAARDQALPALPAGIDILRDLQDDCGPLAGLATGLSALAGRCTTAYVTGCDVPCLKPEFVRHVVESLGAAEIAMPCDNERSYPLAAAYQVSLTARVQALLKQGERRLLNLVQVCRCHKIDVADLRAIDPELQSLWNLNTPAEYTAALCAAGFAKSERAPGARARWVDEV